jgi:hypothetical protein
MTLTTHAIVGAAAARVFSFHPVAAFFAAFASHFLIDALPHWDYKLRSARHDDQNPMNDDMAINRDFFVDLIKIGCDAFLGLLLSYIIFQPSGDYQLWIIGLGVFGGILPDPLQFLYFKWRHEPMVSLQKFHIWIHTDLKLENRWISGGILQLTLIVACVMISWYLTGDVKVPGV